MLLALLVPLALAILVYGFILIRAAVARGAIPKVEEVSLGAITNFFESSGSDRLRRRWHAQVSKDCAGPAHPVHDAGRAHTPTMTQALIFLIPLCVFVDPVLLVGCVIALVLSALLGAPLVASNTVWTV